MHYENFSLKYFEDVRDLVYQELSIGALIYPEDNIIFSSIGVYMTLMETTYGRILVDKGRVKGFILAQVKGNPLIVPKWKIIVPLAFQFVKLWSKWIFSKQTRDALKFFNIFIQNVEKLMTGLSYKSKVHIFVVSKELQGQGVGKFLMNEFQTHLKQQEVSEFVLDTNTRCTYQFYDKNQFERIRESSISQDQLNIDLFIYAKKV